MAETSYQYTIATDFPNGIVDSDRLSREIVAQIATTLERIDTDDGVCIVVFVAALSAGEKTTLDGDASPPAAGSIIGDHTGDPVPDVPKTTFTSSADSSQFFQPTTVPLDGSTISISGIVDTPYTLAASEITLLEAGVYDLVLDVLIEMTSGNSASADAWIETDPDGQGFVELGSSRMCCTLTDGPSSASVSITINCAQNTEVRARAVRVTGDGILVVRQAGIRLTLSKR